MTRVLVCASPAAFQAGLASLLAGHGSLEVVSRTHEAGSLAAALEEHQPDVVLLASDTDEDELLESAAGLIIPGRPPAVVVLRNHPSAQWSADAIRSGVRAVLPREASLEEIVAAVNAAAAGLVVLPPDVAQSLAPGGGLVRAMAPPAKQLTSRETEVLQMLAGGLVNKTIAKRLGISTHTVKFHVGSIMTKLSAASRTEAVTIGLRQGLIYL